MKKLLLLGVVFALIGCANQRFEIKPDANAAQTLDKTETFWVGGIGQAKVVDGAEVCGGAAKVAKVETQQTAPNAFLTLITFGIYAPRQVRVFCTK